MNGEDLNKKFTIQVNTKEIRVLKAYYRQEIDNLSRCILQIHRNHTDENGITTLDDGAKDLIAYYQGCINDCHKRIHEFEYWDTGNALDGAYAFFSPCTPCEQRI